MPNPSLFITALICLSLLAGCVISVGGGYHDGGDSYSEILKQEKTNRKQIAAFPLGVSSGHVLDALGAPDFSESFSSKQGPVRVLRYRTHRAHSDGDTTRDETTPLLFIDDKLVGHGEAAYSRVITQP